jgi:hypothetical protein
LGLEVVAVVQECAQHNHLSKPVETTRLPGTA